MNSPARRDRRDALGDWAVASTSAFSAPGASPARRSNSASSVSTVAFASGVVSASPRRAEPRRDLARGSPVGPAVRQEPAQRAHGHRIDIERQTQHALHVGRPRELRPEHVREVEERREARCLDCVSRRRWARAQRRRRPRLPSPRSGRRGLAAPAGGPGEAPSTRRRASTARRRSGGSVAAMRASSIPSCTTTGDVLARLNARRSASRRRSRPAPSSPRTATSKATAGSAFGIGVEGLLEHLTGSRQALGARPARGALRRQSLACRVNEVRGPAACVAREVGVGERCRDDGFRVAQLRPEASGAFRCDDRPRVDLERFAIVKERGPACGFHHAKPRRGSSKMPSMR